MTDDAAPHHRRPKVNAEARQHGKGRDVRYIRPGQRRSLDGMVLTIPDENPDDWVYPPDFDPRLKGAVNPNLIGTVKTFGDIIGPFHDVWEKGY